VAAPPLPAKPAAPTATPPAEPAPPGLQVLPPSEVLLEDAGTEPREAFRFGAHEERAIVEYSIRQPRTPSGKNTVVIDVSTTPAGEAGAGAFFLVWRLVQVNGVDVYFPYTGQGMFSYYDARGRSLSGSLPIQADDDIPDGLPRELRFIDNCVYHASVPFPEQPIGRGARWSVHLENPEGHPMNSKTHTTYRLVAVNAKHLVIEAAQERTDKRSTPRPVEALDDGESDLQTGSWKRTKKLTLERGRRLAFGTMRDVVHQTFQRRDGDKLTPYETNSTWDCKVSFGGKVPSPDDG
jgi:hypothetical protein